MTFRPQDKPIVRQVLRELRRGTSDPDRRTWLENSAAAWGINLDPLVLPEVKKERRAANPHRQRRGKL